MAEKKPPQPPFTKKQFAQIPRVLGKFLLEVLYEAPPVVRDQISEGDFYSATMYAGEMKRIVKHIRGHIGLAGPLLNVSLSEYRDVLGDLRDFLGDWQDRLGRLASPAGLEEAERQLAIQDQLQAVLRDLTQFGFIYQIVDQNLVKDYPGLAVLSELHPGIRIDWSQNQEETDQLVADLVSRDVRRVDYYGESEGASRFRITAEHALINVRVPKTTEMELLKQLLANLSGLHDPNLLEARLERMGLTLQRVASWLEQLA